MQLDIFNDSREVALRNDVLDALLADRPVDARAAWLRLQAACPRDAQLPALQALVAASEAPAAGAFADPASLAEALRAHREDVVPAANAVFGESDATRWLSPRWASLAQRAASLPFHPRHAEAHAAALWLQAGRPREATAAVLTIPSWRRIPLPLSWMTEARYRIDGLDATWPLLAELAWMAPARLKVLLDRLADPLLRRLLTAFEAEEGGDDLAWFPAWVLTDKPALARLLAAAEPGSRHPPEQALRLMVELIGLERQGRHHDAIDRRRQLQDLQGWLHAACMRTR